MIHRGDLAARHLEAVAAAVLESQRPTTRKVYSAAWERFQAWAKDEGVTPLPADPVTVAAYLVHRDALGLSFASLAMDRKAISFFHRRAGLPTPTASDGVKMTLAGVRNRAAERGRAEPKQARGLREAGLEAIIETAHIPRVYPSGRTESAEAARWRGTVDIAIVSVMRDALLRRGEAANLRWGRREGPAGRELPGHHPALEDVQHARCSIRGRARDGGPETHPPEEAGPEGQGVRRSARQDPKRPYRRDVQGGGTRRRVLGSFPQGGNDPGSDCKRGGARRYHERRTVEVRAHARALLAGRSGRAWGRSPLLRPAGLKRQKSDGWVRIRRSAASSR